MASKALVFGREPAVIVGFVEALLALVLSFGIAGLSAETVGLIVAVVAAVFGVYTAYVTKDTLLGASLGLIKATVALTAAYGFALSAEQLGALLAAVTVAFGLYQRTQTSPAAEPSLDLAKH